MNKRISKKRRLEREVVELKRQKVDLLERIDLLEEVQKLLGSRVDLLEEQVSKNALATNLRFDKLESENKSMRIDLNKGLIEIDGLKKPWYKRK